MLKRLTVLTWVMWLTAATAAAYTPPPTMVFTGETPRSLGYVTLPFPPVTGQSLKLELTARPKDVDAFGQTIEMTGQKDAELADSKNDRGTLAVVEIEIDEAKGGS